MPLVIVNVLVDRECVGLNSVVLDAVETGGLYVREVKLNVVVPVMVLSPELGVDNLCNALGSVRIYLEEVGGLCRGVVLVKLNNCNLLLCRGVANL